MNNNIRFKPRTDNYGEWEAANNSIAGGLKVLEGEICIVIADPASAAAGLSNVQAITNLPRARRLPNGGEILGMKIGDGINLRWDELPYFFPFTEVYYPSGTGRLLGTRNNGGTHIYKTPQAVNRAIFGPVYAPPAAGLNILSNGSGINSQVYEVGQIIPGLELALNPQPASFRIKLGQIFENTSTLTQVGLDETAADPNTISPFSRTIPNFSLTPATAAYDGGGGYFHRNFVGKVLDDRPGVDGGNNSVFSNSVDVRSVYPTFFGKSSAAQPTDPEQLGKFLQSNLTAQLLYRNNYNAGKVGYRNGERPIFAIPEDFGPLGQVLDELGLNQLGYNGAAFNNPVRALLSKAGQYSNVPYRVYTASSGYNADILFQFVF